MKLIEANQLKECGSTLFNDPILKMAVNAVVDNCPGFEIVRCKDCKRCHYYGEDVYGCRAYGMMKITPDGFCSYGERRTDGN